VTKFISVALGAHHGVSEFDCGVPSLNEWLVNSAVRAQKSGTAATYVWTDAGSDRVQAYFAITPHQVSRDSVSGSLSGGVSNIPGYLLAKLALDQDLQGKGLGGDLLHDALARIVDAADRASGRLIVVDAIDEEALRFYQHYDFRPVKDNPSRLVIKIETVRRAFGG
jgi:GNAT superfamily N-acetyltransferase